MKRSVLSFTALALLASSCGSDPSQLTFVAPTTEPPAFSAAAETTAPTTAPEEAPAEFACSGTADPSAPLPVPAWSEVGQRNHEIVIEKSGTGAGKTSSVTPSTLDYVGTDETGTSFRWITEAASIDMDEFGLSDSQAGEVEQFAEEFNGITVDYTVPAEGDGISVNNREQIIDDSMAGFEFIAKQTGDRSVIWAGRNVMESMDDRDFALAITAIQTRYHEIEGSEWPHTTLVESTGRLPNPFGGVSLETDRKFVRSRALDSDGCISIRVVQTPTDAAYTDILNSLAATMNVETSNRQLQSMVRRVDLSNDTVTQIDPTTGLIFRQTTTNTLSLADSRETEVTTVTDVTVNG